MEAVMITAVLVPMLMAAAFLLGRHLHRRQAVAQALSPVTRQHIDLFQGGQLSEAALESAKARYRSLLERGEVAAVEASLRGGVQYVYQVRALAELGTDDAGRILERQLNRRLSEDPIEQSWYWIDLAHGLRRLNREESLPDLLRCPASAAAPRVRRRCRRRMPPGPVVTSPPRFGCPQDNAAPRPRRHGDLPGKSAAEGTSLTRRVRGQCATACLQAVFAGSHGLRASRGTRSGVSVFL